MELKKKTIIIGIVICLALLSVIGVYVYKLMHEHERADNLVVIGMSKSVLFEVLGKPDSIKNFHKDKPNRHLMGPSADWWETLKVGDWVEVWNYRFHKGTLSVYFLNGIPEVIGKDFTPKGRVY